VRLRYRPVRVGWCIGRDDWAGLRAAVRRSFTLWGGRFNPLIIIDDPEQARRMVDLYRVDCLHAVGESSAAAAFIDQQSHLPWPASQKQLVLDRGTDARSSAFADLAHPIRRMFDEDFRHHPTHDPCLTLHEWQPDDALHDLFLMTFGALPSPDECAHDYAGLMRLHLKATRTLLRPGEPVPPPQSGFYTLAGFNRAYIGQHYAVRNRRDHPGIFLGSVACFDDLVHYWNLRAADIPLIFRDPDHADRLTPFGEAITAQLRTGEDTGATSGLTVWHQQARPVDAGDFAHPIISSAIVPELWNGLNLKVPVMQFGEASVLASLDESKARSTITFPLAESPLREGKWPGDRFMVSIDTGIGLFGDDQQTFNLPFLPALNVFYGREALFHWNTARAEPDSIGAIVSAGTNHLSLRAIEVGELISVLFGSVGIKAAPSAAGRVCTRLIQQMGGLDHCRVFRIGGVRDLIERYSPDQSFTRSEAKRIIFGKDGLHPLSDYRDLYIEPRPPGTALTNDAVLAHLLEKDVFRPGLKLSCPNCQLDFWRSLDEVRTRSECEYCGHVFHLGPQLRDRDWALRRSGLFGRNDNQEGALPVVLALQQLAHVVDLSNRLQTTAVSLQPNGAAITPCETDFVLLTSQGFNHKVQIAIGEAKTRHPISRDDVHNLVRVANAFPSDRFDVFLVFAKLADFSDEELEFIHEANGDYCQRVILLTARELEPWFVYERTVKEFVIDEHAVSLADLARATVDVFFSKARRTGPTVAADTG
jgi:hypothetical protein